MKFIRVSRPALSWAVYDVANSAFTTSILTVIFNVYFVHVVVHSEGVLWFGQKFDGTSLWSFLNSAVMVVVLMVSPPLGALADRLSAKKTFLLASATIGASITVLLFFARAGRV